MTEQIQTRLKKARKDLGLTQSQFAEKLGLTQTAYNLIENGKTSLSDKHIKPICAIFGINEEWLRTGINEEFKKNSLVKEIEDVASTLLPINQEYLLTLTKALYQKQCLEYTNPSDPTPTTGEGE